MVLGYSCEVGIRSASQSAPTHRRVVGGGLAQVPTPAVALQLELL